MSGPFLIERALICLDSSTVERKAVNFVVPSSNLGRDLPMQNHNYGWTCPRCGKKYLPTPYWPHHCRVGPVTPELVNSRRISRVVRRFVANEKIAGSSPAFCFTG
jgi:hypothetical protein